ncbi:CmpA/NrtA family ABC transporter substrate-binding protein [Xanthobacter agilis]|uniref:NitT/TauT family transport system ATP-binding protein n=1 Tax=Xanthobacter agilis TaxID=47492 RepID=A0ABU0LAD6_XANAG|nr:CmpA/NrtA family ABC transporter substrate-binding protein [Xanthobacter agilis]MDQ0504089.1 NitT/TauT family transport system ATP-binding protein [Xanthobacter agilis]
MSEDADIRVGFVPLLDSAILVSAVVKGFAREEGLVVALRREPSWSSIRDRLAVGALDAAHILAPMPIAANLGLFPLSPSLIAPFAMGLGGNAVTVSNGVAHELEQAGAVETLDAGVVGRALKAVVVARRGRGLPALRFGVVYSFSGHNFELRFWLAACGIDPDRDVEIVVLPPPQMPAALADGQIDGFCAGEPWNTAAVRWGAGRLATVKARIWRSSPEKVLGVSRPWAEDNPAALDAFVRALYRAALWCADKGNHAELARILAAPRFLDVDPQLLMTGLTGAMEVAPGRIITVDDFFLTAAKAATFPWQSHALWFYSQMVRWGYCSHSPHNTLIARDSYRPDLYRRALRGLGAPLPGANLKVEGALLAPTPVGAANSSLVLGPDGFFDGHIFDPDRIDDYIREQMAARVPDVRGG